MNSYLLESYSPEIKFKKDFRIVALNPKVCYDLEKRGIEFSTIDDYFDKNKLDKIEKEYFEFIVQWRKKFDNFLQNQIPILKKINMKPGMMYFTYLRYLIGVVLVKSYILDCFFDQASPNKIIYVKEKQEEKQFDYFLDYKNKSFFSMLTPIICKEKNISYEKIEIKKDLQKKSIKKRSLKKKILNSKIVKNLYFFLKYGKSCLKNNNKNQKLNILLLKTSKNGLEIVKNGLKKGHNIFLLSNEKIQSYSPFGLKTYENIISNDIRDENFNEIYIKLKESNLIKDINKISKHNIKNIVLPVIKHFILNVIPDTLKYVDFFKEFYEKNKIDYVVTPHRGNPIRIAALSVAKNNNYSKSVYIAHGDEAFDIGKFWNVTELKPFDVHISSNIEKRNFFKNICKKNNIQTKCYCSYHRIKNIRKIREKKSKILDDQIVYLPGFMSGDKIPISCGFPPDIWYYKYLKKIVDYLSTKKEFKFVLKEKPSSDEAYNPISDYIDYKDYSNITVETKPFVEYIKNTGRVICDIPSTGFYESVISGIPTLTTCYKGYEIRKTASKIFGDMIKSHKNAEESITHINDFLKDDRESYKTSIDTVEKNIIEILEEIKEK